MGQSINRKDSWLHPRKVLGEKGAHPLFRVGGGRPVVLDGVAERLAPSCGGRFIECVMNSRADGEEYGTTHLLKLLHSVGQPQEGVQLSGSPKRSKSARLYRRA